MFATAGVRTTAGSTIYENYVPARNATVVEKLLTAGAVVVGKTNLHELAYGITSANPHFGSVRNPWNPLHSPGGSSGGSGAAVATEMVFMAMGTDTGGSIRIPASFCGTVGIKPTYGRVSRFGVLPLWLQSGSYGSAYPLGARCGRGAECDRRLRSARYHRVRGARRWTSCRRRGARFADYVSAFPRTFFFERLDEDVDSAVRRAIAQAESLGAVVNPCNCPIWRR